MDRNNEGVQVAEAVEKFLNHMCNDEDRKMFVEYVTCNMHRTLQQQFMSLLWDCIKAFSKQEHYDLRNEDTVLFCRKVFSAFKDYGYFRFI